ncbi:hypothetical protein SAMN04515691_3969 [Leifsonia sp. 98AMF]|uniref:hypothetical protein n=1 Tax=unclassified Leifsonia TaxID=2663824 RepID=UPI00087D030D|nr:MULTISPECIES: hypothetical protein [unclassified Leifsonia]SDG96388.1 hypothetical protein SAMN04515690_0048 [Leifsonia sp. 197AMF]SDJ45085.1 hypothetical protein SAMN04515684_3735 [Leifsonia sp. 466MF]SDK30801.1 hypothetical protein SAMN04515683_3030 [Leifsonia sp. 157MF]SDN65422.1 hypothetical protein SAMN04515686_1922 [Leifsonia sp. 509MF]SEN43262.1 hypothetical protein SAMN04515685_3013 [Leifsonia sp. 467MF]
MRLKTVLILVVVAVAYLLGARAGRERYEQITEAVTSFWNAPDVKKARKKAAARAQKARKRLS